MPQFFHPSANSIAKGSLVFAVLLVFMAGVLLWVFNRSPMLINQGATVAQWPPFSHKHHVKELGIDCRFCHTSVEESSSAGFPPTETCMTCHSQVWNDTPMLEEVRRSYFEGVPMSWNRVHNLPDFVFFDHSIHVASGVSCQTCHGDVDEMPLLYQAEELTMGWCLECHREPERFIGPRDEVYEFKDFFTRGKTDPELGEKLLEDYHIHVSQLENCSVCHR